MSRLLSAVGFALFVFLGWSMIQDSAATYDEPVHLASGFAALNNGSRLINAMDHPPLAEMWAALPLLPLRPAAFFQHPDWLAGRVYHYADLFLYKNRVDAERMLNAARLWCLISWGGLLFLGLLSWAGRLDGAPAAAALLAGLCPPLFSNAALVTTDAGSAVFFFLTFAILSAGRRGWGRWLAAGAAMGAAMACKFNMIVLPFFVAAMLMAEWNLRRRQDKARLPLGGFAALLAACAAVIMAAYRFVHWPWYCKGLFQTMTRLGEGRGSFFFGAHSTAGQFLYFPAALAVKTPLALLLAAALGVWVLWREAQAQATGGNGSGRFLDMVWLTAPPAVYFIMACLSKTQIGYRHILPVYPFLIVLGAKGAAWIWRRVWGKPVCLVLGIWLMASVWRCHPSYLAYFNELVGGPDQGYRCLVDSNLDWGQGLKPLAGELRRMGNPPIYFCYFGVADPAYYGIRYVPVGMVDNLDSRAGTAVPGDSDRVLFAVSVTNLQTTYYADHALFDWLKARRPLFVAGRSIFLYDLSDDADAVLRLAGLVEAAGAPAAAAKLRSRHVHPA